jgi:hypothetical protein
VVRVSSMRNHLNNRAMASAWTGSRLTGRLHIPVQVKLVIELGKRKPLPSYA